MKLWILEVSCSNDIIVEPFKTMQISVKLFYERAILVHGTSMLSLMLELLLASKVFNVVKVGDFFRTSNILLS